MKDILNTVITTTDQNTISHTVIMVVVTSGIIIKTANSNIDIRLVAD
jgi:hypothetical protein